MDLDLRTIYLAGAITCTLLGLVQLLAFATGRFERWPLWWGLSNLLIGIGTIGVALRGSIPDLISIPLANLVSWTGYLLTLYSVRTFAGRPARLPIYLAAIAIAGILLLLWNEPEGFTNRVMLMSVLASGCDIAVVREGLNLLRRERLVSGAILIGLFAPTAATFAFNAYLAASGQIGPELFTPNEAQPWLAVTGTAFLLLRGCALLLLATERHRNALVSLAQQDALTGALNRNGLERSIEELTAEAVRRPRRLAVLLIDIDHFKRLNDTHGHAAGDKILLIFADAARSELRASDILARQGGDEFVVVLPHLTAAEAIGVANRIRAAFGRALAAWGETRVKPTLSIGVAEGNVADNRLEALLQQADEALYRSKRLGRDRAELHPAAALY